MFTGIVEELGRLRDRAEVAGADRITRFTFDAPKVRADASIGDSIAVNGCCLTVVALDDGGWSAEATAETLGRTDLAGLAPGDPVNLERPVRLMDRLGGHLVQGHVDGVGAVVQPAPDLLVRAPAEVLRYLVVKGSVTVAGVSLTVVALAGDTFSVAVIPHTAEVTTLGRLTAGAPVNLEVDVIAKYAERLLAAGVPSPYPTGLRAGTEEGAHP
jgi:riboflavin synthase